MAEAVFLRVGSRDRVHRAGRRGPGWREPARWPRRAARRGSILTGERMALNFLGRLCGIATLTARFVQAVEGTGARILDTRKTTPGLRGTREGGGRAREAA